MLRKAVLLLSLLFLLAACAPAQADGDAVATIVAATIQASQPTAAPATQAPSTGRVEGQVCYPSSGIPPMNVYLQLIGTENVITVPIAQNQSSYSVELPNGSYQAYAWLPDFSIGGSYSQAVACGLSAECSDHSLITFDVTGGSTTGGVNVCDWYGDPGSVPYPPGAVQEQPAVLEMGSIAGSLSYPSEMIPAMTVVAFDANFPNVYFWVTTAQGSSTYQIDNLPANNFYYIVAYVDGLAGGYTNAVPCGLSADCTDHSLMAVLVSNGQVSYGADPTDWYAPQGDFPAKPF